MDKDILLFTWNVICLRESPDFSVLERLSLAGRVQLSLVITVAWTALVLFFLYASYSIMRGNFYPAVVVLIIMIFFSTSRIVNGA